MKYIKESVIIILTVVLIITVINYFVNPNVIKDIEIEYLPGTIDTLKVKVPVIDSLWYPVYIPAKADTFEAVTGDSLVAEADFEINVTDSTSITGNVKYSDEMFVFKNVTMKYPYIINTITQIDTLMKTITIENNSPFKHIAWFFTTLGLLAIILFT